MAATVPTSSAAKDDAASDEFHDAASIEDSARWKRVLSNYISSYFPAAAAEVQSWFAVAAPQSGKRIAALERIPGLGWGFWILVFSTAFLAWDPLRIRHVVAFSRQYRFHKCENPSVECCRPVPDVNDWPADPANRLNRSVFFSDTGIPGPESLAWDLEGKGPYAGVADGRVIRWREQDGLWETFAYASPYWTVALCSYEGRGEKRLELEHLCGRPLGLRFHPISGALYIADAYFGLAMVGRDGGQAELLNNESEGVPHTFTNDLDIGEDGTVYFSVSSTRRPRRECNVVVAEGDNTGRLLKYDPKAKNSTLLLKDVRYPNGLALSKDGSFLLIASTLTNRVLKYWLQGSKAGHIEVFAHQPGYPDNIRSTENGDFWVAIHGRRTKTHVFLCKNKWASVIIFPLSQTYKILDKMIGGPATVMAIKYNADGVAIDVLEDRTRTSYTPAVSNAQERDGTLWLSSIYSPIISLYRTRV